MGMFDQTARQASKLDGPSFFAWVLRRCHPVPPLTFHRWDDTRRVTPPGWPERTDDVVAVLQHNEQPQERTWVLVEAETEPERFIHHRLGIYSLLLGMELASAAAVGQEPSVGMILLNLTGRQRSVELRLVLPTTDKGTWVNPLVIPFEAESAAATLAEIAAGQTGLCLLPWIVLMDGGGEPALIEEWKRVALLETSGARRALYRDLVLVFAELRKELVNWQRALEGWEMQESQVILGWINRGEQQGMLKMRRWDLLETVRVRLQDPVPENVRLAVEGTNDKPTLDRWFQTALKAQTLAELVTEMRQQP